MSVTPVLAILVAIGCGLALVAVAIIVVLRIRPTVYASAANGGGGSGIGRSCSVVTAGVNGLNGGTLRSGGGGKLTSSSFVGGATHLPLSQRDPDECFDMDEKEPDLIPHHKGEQRLLRGLPVPLR